MNIILMFIIFIKDLIKNPFRFFFKFSPPLECLGRQAHTLDFP